MRRRWLLGTISGACFGLFLALDLLFFGVIRLDSALVTLLPAIGLLVGFGLGVWGPRGK